MKMDTTNDSYQEASDMLAEALKQMDGILAGTLKREHKNQNGIVENSSPKLAYSPKPQNSRAVKLLNDLHMTLDGVDDRGRIFRQLPPDTQMFFQKWMSHNGNQTLSNGYSSTENLEDKVRKLENEKDNLTLQVSVLSDQIEAQVEKIRDLERMSRSCKNGNVTPTNGHAEMNGDVVNLELLNRNMPSHDMHKLDLMAENSNLKLRLAGMEREKSDFESRLQYSQRRIDELQSRLNDQTIEVNELRMRAVKNGTIPMSPDPSDLSRDRTLERDRTLDRLKRKHSEVERLKKAVESLMVTNSEKDHYIDDLKKQMKKYNGHEHMEDSDSSSTPHSHTSTNQTLLAERYDNVEQQHPELRHILPNATSTPVTFGTNSPKSPIRNLNQNITPPSHTVSSGTHSPSRTSAAVGIGRSSSCENMKPKNGTPPLIRPGQGFGGTLPKDVRLTSGSALPVNDSNHQPITAPETRRQNSQRGQHRPRASTLPKGKGKPPIGPSGSGSHTPGTLTPQGSVRHRGNSPDGSTHASRHANQSSSSSRGKRGFMSFGKGFFKKSGKWSSSAPNLAQTETDEEALKDEMAQEYKQLQRQRQTGDAKKSKNKGIKRFFGKLKRSNSQEMDPDKLEDFKRSGLRATAGARLGWSRDLKSNDLDMPFSRWDTERVSAWLHALGLSMYVGECKRWLKNGQQLLDATSQDLEKEMGVRNHFHRKKLHLALQSVGSENHTPMDYLDFNWVTRWLDDIGLPQYKDTFLDARVDGRMLHYMTVEDLVTLKVTNTLHHLSIKRGIEVLRLNDFNAACLKRRPTPEEGGNGELQNVPSDVMLWTNHRVMEWLRSIDLSEYAPNLRGSGVHGGLMVLEARFSYEIFASLLSIPSNKTLLRRHLSTHYVTLIGSEMQQKKRELQAQPGFTPLTPNQKVKLKKRLFSHRRTRSETADEELVCPVGGQTNGKVLPNGSANGSPVWSKDAIKRDNKENMLAKDRFLDNVPTSDV